MSPKVRLFLDIMNFDIYGLCEVAARQSVCLYFSVIVVFLRTGHDSLFYEPIKYGAGND